MANLYVKEKTGRSSRLLFQHTTKKMLIEKKINNTLELEYAGNLEIVVVDSNSLDNTVQIVQKFETVKIVAEEERLGKTHALNRALKKRLAKLLS